MFSRMSLAHTESANDMVQACDLVVWSEEVVCVHDHGQGLHAASASWRWHTRRSFRPALLSSGLRMSCLYMIMVRVCMRAQHHGLVKDVFRYNMVQPCMRVQASIIIFCDLPPYSSVETEVKEGRLRCSSAMVMLEQARSAQSGLCSEA